jgi:hypothetical protein
VLARLRDETGCSTHLAGARSARSVVFVSPAPGARGGLERLRRRLRVPAHAALIGRLLLGDLDRDRARGALSRRQARRRRPETRRRRSMRSRRGSKPSGRRGYGISDSNSASSLFPRGMIAIPHRCATRAAHARGDQCDDRLGRVQRRRDPRAAEGPRARRGGRDFGAARRAACAASIFQSSHARLIWPSFAADAAAASSSVR